MKIAVLKERAEGETRVALTPETAKKFIALGAEVSVEAGAGETAAIADSAFRDAGASVGPAAEVVRKVVAATPSYSEPQATVPVQTYAPVGAATAAASEPPAAPARLPPATITP